MLLVSMVINFKNYYLFNPFSQYVVDKICKVYFSYWLTRKVLSFMEVM